MKANSSKKGAKRPDGALAYSLPVAGIAGGLSTALALRDRVDSLPLLALASIGAATAAVLILAPIVAVFERAATPRRVRRSRSEAAHALPLYVAGIAGGVSTGHALREVVSLPLLVAASMGGAVTAVVILAAVLRLFEGTKLRPSR